MIRSLAFAALAALSAVPALAQGVRSADVVTWTARAERSERGGTARVVLDAVVAPGWRMYALASPVGIPLAVTLEDLPAGVEAGSLRQSEPSEAYDPAFERDYPYFSGTARIVQSVRVGRRTARGSHEVRGNVRYAVCDDSVCLPSGRTAFRVPLIVE